MTYDRIWRGGRIASMAHGAGVIEDGAVASRDGRIAWAGPSADPPGEAAETIDLEGRLVTPGLIDCHTHLVFGADRAAEFGMRMDGATYEQIAASGGGILSSVRATRAADEESLFDSAARRLDCLTAEGVTTVEIKSGYGLDPESELKMLRVARRLGRDRPVRVAASLLAAHAVPPEFAGDRAGYVDLIVNRILPEAASLGLADSVDAFCEHVAFTPDEVARVFQAARALGLPVRLHADQRSDGGGAALAARFDALSADHLEWTGPAGAAALARAGTVAVLLPGAFHALRETQAPPVGLFRAHGVKMAVATDCNPGTSPLTSLLLAMNFAVVRFGLTIAEAVSGVTVHAARALGLSAETGSIEPGKACDLAVWDAADPAELIYWTGRNLLHRRVFAGA